MNLNLDYLLSTTWEYLALVRVYTKKRGGNYNVYWLLFDKIELFEPSLSGL